MHSNSNRRRPDLDLHYFPINLWAVSGLKRVKYYNIFTVSQMHIVGLLLDVFESAMNVVFFHTLLLRFFLPFYILLFWQGDFVLLY